MCQNCYFTRELDTEKLKVRGHNHLTHHIELIVEPREQLKKYVKCHGCQTVPITGVRYKCDNCFDFSSYLPSTIFLVSSVVAGVRPASRTTVTRSSMSCALCVAREPSSR